MNKIKITLLIICMLGADKKAGAQTFQWAKKIGAASESNVGYSITTDAAGNSYTTGTFWGVTDFDPGAGVFNLTATFSNDAFICKFNPAGNFLWAKLIDGTVRAEGHAIDVDNSGNILIVGVFSTTADLDPGPAVFNVTATPFHNIFVVKLNSAGNFVWGRKIAGTDNIHCYEGLATDAAGNVHLGGFFTGTIDFDPGPGTYNLSNAGGVTPDIFILKLTSAGNLSWVFRIGSTQPDYCRDIALDASGNVYAGGDFQGTVDFDPGAGAFNMTDAGGGYILKLTSAGTFVWARQINSVGVNNTTVSSVAVESGGNVYASGVFFGTADLDPGAGAFNVTSAGAQDIFVVKLTSAGNFTWGKYYGGTQPEWINNIALDNLNNVYIMGRFRLTVDFNPGVGTYNLTSAGIQDVFISKLTSAGNFTWACRLGSATSNSLGFNSIAIDASLNVYNTGQFNSTLDFNPFAGTFNMTATGDWDMVIHKIGRESPLPIELLTFEAHQNKTAVDITWQTATETNNDYFTIEKSKEGDEFEETGKVNGAGNSITVLSYSFTDKNPHNGISYYRLKQTDFNGEFSYSKIVALNLKVQNNEFIIYNNSSSGNIIITFYNSQMQSSELTIQDMTGRIVCEQQITSPHSIINAHFSPGIYVANVTDGQQQLTKKFIIN